MINNRLKEQKTITNKKPNTIANKKSKTGADKSIVTSKKPKKQNITADK